MPLQPRCSSVKDPMKDILPRRALLQRQISSNHLFPIYEMGSCAARHDVRVAGISDPGYAFTIRLTTITDAGVDAPAGAASETGSERNDRSSERTSGLRCSGQESPR